MAETAQASQQAQPAKEQLNVAQQLEQSCDELAKYGGFDLLEASIDGTQNMNPERRARKRIFLNENAKKQEREALKKRLEVWVDLLSR